MNSLSWTLYFAGIVGTLSSWLTFMGIIGGLGTIAAFIWWLIIAMNPRESEIQSSLPFQKQLRRIFVTLFVVGVVFDIFLPSRQTIIMIAGSQYGERIMKSEKVQGVVDPGLELLKTWLEKETDKLKAPSKEK